MQTTPLIAPVSSPRTTVVREQAPEEESDSFIIETQYLQPSRRVTAPPALGLIINSLTKFVEQKSLF